MLTDTNTYRLADMNNCEGVPSHNISYMGYTVRTASFRYTEWLKWDGARCKAVWPSTIEAAEPTMRELYSHEGQHSCEPGPTF